MWFGFFYALAYLFWTMIYFAWRGHWIYGFLDWSKPVQHLPKFIPPSHSLLRTNVASSAVKQYGCVAGLADFLHWNTSALGRVLRVLDSDLPQLPALSESTSAAWCIWHTFLVVARRRASRQCAKRRVAKCEQGHRSR